MKVYLKHDSGMVKEVKIGFSWTTFFFGIFPALFRGDWKWAGIMFICNLLSYGVATMIFAFFYNKLYIKDLLEKGWKPSTDVDNEILIQKGLLAA